MKLEINGVTHTETLIKMCDACEICSSVYGIETYQDYLRCREDCSECEDCEQHAGCGVSVFCSGVGSAFCEIASINSEAIVSDVISLAQSFRCDVEQKNGDMKKFEDLVQHLVEKNTAPFFSEKIGTQIWHAYCAFNQIDFETGLPMGNRDSEWAEHYSKYEDFTGFLLNWVLSGLGPIQELAEYCSRDQSFLENEKYVDAIYDLGILYLPESESDFAASLKEAGDYEARFPRGSVISKIIDCSEISHPVHGGNTYFVSELRDVAGVSLRHIISSNLPIKRCKNCGKYFVPTGRSDTLYCDRTSPQDGMRTCKEYGSQRLWYDKLKEDKILKLSRNIYMSKQMLVKRNPDILGYKEMFEAFKNGRKAWSADVSAGLKSRDDYEEWLNEMKSKKVL